MHRVLLTGGPSLLREAYARIIEDSALLTVQVQIPDLAHALAQLPSLRPRTSSSSTPWHWLPPRAPRHCCPCAEPAARTTLAVIGDTPAEEVGPLLRVGATGILGRQMEAAPFVMALDLIGRGGTVVCIAVHRREDLRRPSEPDAGPTLHQGTADTRPRRDPARQQHAGAPARHQPSHGQVAREPDPAEARRLLPRPPGNHRLRERTRQPRTAGRPHPQPLNHQITYLRCPPTTGGDHGCELVRPGPSRERWAARASLAAAAFAVPLPLVFGGVGGVLLLVAALAGWPSPRPPSGGC